MKKIKYPRIEKKDRTPYVTGDAQDWTYQYTWEDFLETFNDASSDQRSERTMVFRAVREYFLKYPEEALAGKVIDQGWTVNNIKRICEISICC